MTARRRNRNLERSLARRRPFRDPLPLILVVCEGKVTERDYIDGFRLAHGASTVRVQVASPGGDPQGLVERAIGLRDDAARMAKRTSDENLVFDEVWCVFDVDTHARLDAARRTAQAGGVEIALSNPCFELWLLLHLAEHSAHVTAERVHRLLRKHLPHYDKHLRFDDVASGYTDAVRRAEHLDRRHTELGQPEGNPSTGMHRLTERIRQFGKEARL
jgi:hypothetical protein